HTAARKRGQTGHVSQTLQDCFRVSIAQLHADARPLLLSMASHSPLSTPLHAVDHVAGPGSTDITHEKLGALRSSGLVERDASDRCRIHRLLRDYLRDTYRNRGFGLLRPTWEIASLPWLLRRMGPLGRVSAGFAAYDLRQEHWFLSYAEAHRAEPAKVAAE